MDTSFLPDDSALLAALEREGPMNLARAVAVMERHDLAGMVLGDPVNVFHALGHWPQIGRTRMGQPPGTFALIARARPQQPGLVTSRFLHHYSWADGRDRGDVAIWLYTFLGDEGDETPGEVPAAPVLPQRDAAPLTVAEDHRAAISAREAGAMTAHGDAAAAIVAAMRGLGLWQGRIGFDHPVIAQVAHHHDHPGATVQADNILREIRLVKSPLEHALMAHAAKVNVDALNAVGSAIRAGASHSELQALFRMEAAARGNTAVFLNVDRVSSELSRLKVADGQTLMLDGVSQHLGYHGDFARTVFVGEPTRIAARAAEAAAFGWQAVREKLRPGLRYSEIAALGEDAIRKAGYDAVIGFGPHSVGLAHTDEPGEVHGGFWRKPDIVLEPGMILSVDCPTLDTGIGGSAHCEDLVLITETGCEPIHPLHEPVIIV
ncbi:Xaa-Pro peptidase family protein [Novosphingobium sp. P6W]|uniref:M24 family metallopeptidase n=1 Tax=Novosphingobium sp. P6W TaxID=1609758 RepID=UPI0005C2DC83|nr:M24 family metallopeptidase [Novosphingobium sp. P6W]AXB79410.1 aminopeptidase P family protein [Novosphingobium sp. P6W]KIS34175.1 peptidase M24 [Novosphingobium sp. P6W]